MSRKSKACLIIALAALVVLTTAGLISAAVYAARLPEHVSDQDTVILGQSRLIPGAPAVLHIQVRRHENAAPVRQAVVTVSLKPRGGGVATVLFTGATDASGRVVAQFTVPEVEQPEQAIIVETRSDFGRDALGQPVTVQRSFKVLVITDKPIYQPGQPILIRTLAVGSFDRRPAASSPIEVIVADAKGNKVFRQTATTSDYGVASWTFQLADEVNHGLYKITATLGDTSSERTVTVQPYVLPKFRITATADGTFYRPGQTVTGEVEAAYFFGRPVDGAQVQLAGWVYDVERQQVLDLKGQTGPEGTFPFEFRLPESLVAGAEQGVADYVLEVSVTDSAAHTEQVSLRIPVAQQGLLVDAVPESGQFKPGLENILYLLTAYPDGTPAECDVDLTVNGRRYQAHTGPYGLGELRLTPDSPVADLRLVAQDALGHSGEASLFVEGEYTDGQILLRPERATYHVGETMNLEILTTESGGTIYLDITREGQTLSTRALDVRDGKATAAVDLTPDLREGTLTLHAYKPQLSGEIVRDTRLVIVEAAADLDLDVRWDSEVYRPGDKATLDVAVTGQDGVGVPSALGLAIVDESVFALQQQDPGFARLYFLLEQELLQPQFDLHGLTFPELMQPIRDDEQRTASRDAAAQASLAGIDAVPFTLSADSRELKAQQARERQEHFFGVLAQILFPLLLAVPLLGAGALGYALWRERLLGRSVLAGVGAPLLVAASFAAALWLLPVPGAPWATTPGEKLGYLLQQSSMALLCLVGPVLLGGLVAAVALAVRAVRKRDMPLGVSLLMLAAYAVLLPLFVAVFAATNPAQPSPASIVALLAAYLALPLAWAARAAGYGFQRQSWALVGTVLVALLALFSVAGSAVIVEASGSMAAAPLLAQDGIGGGPAMRAVVEVTQVVEMAVRAPEPTAAPAEPDRDDQSAGQDQDALLLRQFFPETMYWNPEALTDADGRWQAQIDLAHTITTWRLTALANAQDGRIGSTTASLRVFQDFFVDIDLPVSLTQGDEVSMPVAVYNYLDTGQAVELALEPQDWFEALGPAVQTVEVAASDVTVVYFPIRVTATEGRFRPVVTAIGEQMSDATTLRHDVQVLPNGKRFDLTLSDRLSGDVEQTVTIPGEAIPGTAQLLVKIYPGVLSQVVEGLDALLRMPYGCFEQTSSTTYPNVLVLDYLKSTSQASPEAQMHAEEYINLGYQRLTTFEVPGGGFSLFGENPADRMLTSYGLMEFSDMAQVHPVDEAMIGRAAAWLLSQQQEDGSWENDQGLVHESSWQSLGNERLPVTSYVAWALVEAGYGDEPGTQRALDYVREFQAEAEDAYALALVADALAAADPQDGSTQAVLDRLADLAVVEGDGAYWLSDIATFTGATGQTSSIETTALAAYAFLRAEQHTELANQALTYLIQQKDSYGTWDSTQATVLTLKALILSVRKGGEGADATVSVSLNGEEADPIRLSQENLDVVQLVSFTDKAVMGDNRVRIAVNGQGNLMYQVAAHYYVPWDTVPPAASKQPLMDIALSYDRTELAVNDVVNVSVRVRLNQGVARQAIVDLGVPPGFEVLTDDLADLVARHSDRAPGEAGPKVSRFDLTGRQIIVYLEGLKAGEPLDFAYRIRASYPIKAQTPPSSAYDYYNPTVSAVAAPSAVEVMP